MSKKIITTLLVIAMFIPTVIAIISYIGSQNATADNTNIIEIQIEDPQKNLYDFKRSRDEDSTRFEEVLNLFMEMEKGATEQPSLPQDLADSQCFLVSKIMQVDKANKYEYYFTTDPTECYYTYNGEVFLIKAESAAKFLSSEYAECMYVGANIPVLTLSGSSTAKPSSLEWSYRNYKGEFTSKKTGAYLATDTESFDLVGTVSIAFSIEPDTCSVTVTDTEGKVVFDGEKYEPAVVTEKSEYTVKVLAAWSDDTKNYKGSAEYNFKATVLPPPEFSLTSDTIAAGKFSVISIKGAADPALAKATSSPELPTPEFFKDGDNLYALLAVPYESETGAYSIAVTYGGCETTLALNVTSFGDSVASWYSVGESVGLAYDPAVLTANRSEDALAEYEALITSVTTSDIAKEAKNTKLFDGYFLGPNDKISDDSEDSYYGGYKACKVRFGEKIAITGNEHDSMTFINNGIDQYYSGNVVSANGGKVVYAGETAYTGKVVVVSHGWNLYTWYWNMGEVSVSEGDTVSRGDVIGKTGTTGFSTGNEGVHISMSVGNTFVCPYDTWTDDDAGYGQGIKLS